MGNRLIGTDRKALAAQLLADIDAACVAHYEGEPREHLGASEIGENCARRLVYSFRWMHRESFSGQMQRLFNRGHREESRIIEWLRWIGCDAKEHDENGKQFRISCDASKHFGGSLDGKLILPERYKIAETFLLEMKTHNLKSFTKLVKEGVKLSKPKHYKQMCVYGTKYGYDYGLYFAICKNDDNLHLEIIELETIIGKAMEEKALGVINAERLPFKIAGSSAHVECKFCPMVGVCHNGGAIAVNCRSCKNSIAMKDGSWHCNVWAQKIPDTNAILKACPQWSAFK